MSDDTRDQQPGEEVSERWSQWRATVDLEEYYSRWTRIEQRGESAHGEADLVVTFHPQTVLDAGCGMGRVAIELSRRGVDATGADLDDDLLAYARRAAPSLTWVHADLATMQLGRRFDVVVMAGNVMIFCRPGDRQPIIANLARHLGPNGLLVAGFNLEHEGDALTLADYDMFCTSSGLELEGRWATWDRQPYTGGGYAVSVHRAP